MLQCPVAQLDATEMSSNMALLTVVVGLSTTTAGSICSSVGRVNDLGG